MTKPKLYDEDDIARFVSIFAEQLKAEFKTVFESIGYIHEQVKKISKIEADINHIKSDIAPIKALLKIHDKEIKQLQTVAHSH